MKFPSTCIIIILLYVPSLYLTFTLYWFFPLNTAQYKKIYLQTACEIGLLIQAVTVRAFPGKRSLIAWLRSAWCSVLLLKTLVAMEPQLWCLSSAFFYSLAPSVLSNFLMAPVTLPCWRLRFCSVIFPFQHSLCYSKISQRNTDITVLSQTDGLIFRKGTVPGPKIKDAAVWLELCEPFETLA